MSNLSETPEPPLASGPGMCADHPDLRAAFVCGLCARAICSLCAFTRTDGSRICTTCANATSAQPQDEGPKLAGRGHLPPEHVRLLKCIQHPNVNAVQVCKGCGAPMCGVCDFSLPVDLHLCPRCAVAPPRRTSKSRRALVATAYAIAAYETVALALFTSGALSALFSGANGRQMAGLFFSLGLFFPAVAGAAVGISSIDRRLNNPAAFWVAAIWNSVLLGLHLLFIIIGSMKA